MRKLARLQYKEWQSTVEKNGDVCKSFADAGTSKQKCEEKVAMCKQQISPLATPTADKDNDIDKIYDMAMGVFNASQNQSSNVDPNTGKKKLAESCYKFTNKDIRQAEKERKEEVRKLEKEIQDEKKKINEANEKLRKEENEIKVDQQKLQADLKKTLQKLEVSKREKYTKINEDIQASSTSIRKLSNEIIKSKQAAEKVKFEHMKTMTSYTEDKINQQCKSAIDTAKVCFIKASKGAKFTEKDTCSSFAFSGKGSKGTAELKKKLKQVSEACFEQNNQAASTIKYNYADSVRNSEMEIKEKQEQINDANKALELKKTEFDSVTKEMATEKSDEEKSVSEQMNNLTERLQGVNKTITESKQDSDAIIANLQNKLAKLAAVELSKDLAMSGKESSDEQIELVTAEAERALNSNENARALAEATCKCPSGDPTICGILGKAASSYLAPEPKKGTGKAQPKTGT
jgi:chromosome segregation ATPase